MANVVVCEDFIREVGVALIPYLFVEAADQRLVV